MDIKNNDIDSIIKRKKNKNKISFSWGFEYRYLQDLTNELYDIISKKYLCNKDDLILIRTPSISSYNNLTDYLKIKQIIKLTPDLVFVEGKITNKYMLYLKGTLAYLLPGQSYLDAIENLKNNREITQNEIDDEYTERLKKHRKIKSILDKKYSISDSQIAFNWGSGGSLELILWSVKNRIKKNPSILINLPNYFYTVALAQKFKYKIKTVLSYKGNKYHFPFRTMLKELKTRKYDIIVLTSPNNPFGVPIEKNKFYELLKNLPVNTYALLDFTGLNDETMFYFKNVLREKQFEDKKIIMIDSLSKNFEMCHARSGIIMGTNDDVFKELEIQNFSPILTKYAYNKLEEALTHPEINTNVINKHKKYFKLLKSSENDNFKIISPGFGNFIVSQFKSQRSIERFIAYLASTYDYYDLPFKGIGKFNMGKGSISQGFIPYLPKNNLRIIEETAAIISIAIKDFFEYKSKKKKSPAN